MQMDANRKKFWSDVKRKTRSHQAKKLCAIKVLHEDWDKSVEDLIRVWNHSSEQEKMVETFYTLHAAHAGSDDPQISKKDYNTFASIVHGLVSINNCGRAGQAGSIRNLECQAIKFGPEQETKDVNGFNIPLVVDEDRLNKTSNIQFFFITHDHFNLIKMYIDVRERFFMDKVGLFCE